MATEPSPAQGSWEYFHDTSYFDLWCVRPVGSTEFGEGFHLANEMEAERLCALLNKVSIVAGPAAWNQIQEMLDDE